MKKSLIATVMALLCAANLCVAGGGKVAISINTSRAYCPPSPSYCPPAYRPLPSYGGCQPISYYSWGPSVIAYTTSPANTFSTVSTTSFKTSPPVYIVPPPVFPTAEVTTYPGSSFRWK